MALLGSWNADETVWTEHPDFATLCTTVGGHLGVALDPLIGVYKVEEPFSGGQYPYGWVTPVAGSVLDVTAHAAALQPEAWVLIQDQSADKSLLDARLEAYCCALLNRFRLVETLPGQLVRITGFDFSPPLPMRPRGFDGRCGVKVQMLVREPA